MTTNTTALTLFASTIASSLGFVLTMNGAAPSMLGAGESNALVLFGGLALLLGGGTVFVGVASRALKADTTMRSVVLGSMGAGLLSVWFWLVPANIAVMTLACRVGNLNACTAVASGGGFAADIAHSNDEFVVQQCEVYARAKYCRLAAARRLSSPSRFCPNLHQEDGFEVVEWCTPSRDRQLLVARR